LGQSAQRKGGAAHAPGGGRRRGCLRRLAVLAALLFVVGLVLYLLRWELFGGKVRREVRSALCEALDAEVEIGELSGSLLSDLRLERIRIRPHEGSALAEPLNVESLSLEYSLPALLFGAGRPLGRARLEGARIVLRSGGASPPGRKRADLAAVVELLRGAWRWPSVQVREVDLVAGKFFARGISGRLQLYGDGEEGSADLDLQVKRLSAGELELGRAECRATLRWPAGGAESGARLELDAGLDGRLATARVEAGIPLGRPTPPGECRLKISARVNDGAALSGGLPVLRKLTARLWNSAELEFAARGPAGRIKGSGELKLLPAGGAGGAAPATIELGYDRGVLRVSDGNVATPWGRLRLGGELPLRLDLEPLPKVSAPDEEASLFARLEVEKLEELLPEFLPELAGLKPAGRAALTARLGGTLTAPRPSGRLEISGGRLQPPDPLAPVENIEAVARLTPGRLVLESLRAEMGDRPVSASGRVDFGAKLRVTGSVTARDALVVSSADGTVRLRADAGLRVDGEAEGVRVSGTVAVKTLQYYREFVGGGGGEDQVRALADRGDVIRSLAVQLPSAAGGGTALPGIEGLEGLKLDLVVTAPGEVRVENSTVGALLAGKLRLQGSVASPALSGEIRAQGGEVRLFPGTFLPVRNLRVQLPSKPGAEPHVNFESFRAIGRVRVFIGVSGPLGAPRLRLTSEPPYPQAELLGLLVYGRAPGAVGGDARAAALLGQAARIFGGLVSDRMPRAEPAPSLLSRLRFSLARGAEQRRQGSVWQRPGPDTVMFAEYVINKYLALVTRRDDQGRLSADLQLRLRWPRMGQEPHGGGKPRPSPAGAQGKPGSGEAPQTVFEGNRAFGAGRLLEELAPDLRRLGAEGWSRHACSDAAFRLRHFYLEAGYYFVRVTWTLPEDKQAARFKIHEGPLVRLGAVDFRGNSEISDAELRKALFASRPGLGEAPFTARMLKAQAESLEAHYRAEGYLRAAVSASDISFRPETRLMDVTHALREGPRFRLRRVSWKGVGEEELAELEKISAPFVGGLLRASVPDRIAFAARDRYRQRGQLAARVTARLQLDEAKRNGELIVEVSPGPRLRLRRTNVSGARLVREKFVRRVARLRPGELLTQSTIRRAERRLGDTGLFRRVHAVPARLEGAGGPEAEGELSALLRLEVEEVRPHEFKLRAGYGSFDGVRVGAELGTRNAFGNGESFSLAASASQRGYRLDAEARLFPSPGLPLRAGLHAFYEEREDLSFRLRDLGASPSLLYRPTRNDELAFGLLFEWIDTDDVALGVPPGDEQGFRLAAPFVSLTHDRRDSRFLPRRGYLLIARAEAADEGLFGDISYRKVTGSASGYLPAGSAVTLAASLKGGLISPAEDTREIPIALRFFAGGADTVRGFDERELGPGVEGDPTGGELFVSAQTELRFRIWRGLHGAAFFDAGNVFARQGDFDFDDLRYGAGPGLRYHTPAGALGVDLGFNLDRRDDEPRAVFHLVFGFSF